MRVAGSPIVNLRLAFVALGIGLWLAIGLLLQSAISRLDAQRKLRHSMVAERVFDEAERELGNLLEHEVQRPASAYDATDTDPKRWSPFVVAYYRRDPALTLLAEAGLDAKRRARARAAVVHAAAALDAAHAKPADQAPSEASAPDADDPAQRSSPDVLRQLNRSVKVRERRQRMLTQNIQILSSDRNTLIVERRSSTGARCEGFVVDISILISTIQSWVLTAQGLDRVATLSSFADTNPLRDHGYRFVHRLAAPLDSQQVFLRLSRLDDEDASSALYGLAGLLAAAVVLGLYALYRMVAVQLRFAEKRNNFVSAVTHELKTPLTAIRMYGEMLRDGMVKSEATKQEYYATITAEGERLSRLVDNVMEHAKLRRGARPMTVVPTDIGKLVHEVVELMMPHIRNQGFEIKLQIDDGLPSVEIDRDALKQVFFNVLDNALKYGSGDGTPRVEVACAAIANELVVSVRDFGKGVAEANLGSIFEPFFRGEDELTRSRQGTGIGLALVRDLVQRMSGTVQGLNREPGFEIRIAFRTVPALSLVDRS